MGPGKDAASVGAPSLKWRKKSCKNLCLLAFAAGFISDQPMPWGASMRVHHIIAVATVLVIVLGAKFYFFPPKQAEARLSSVSMNVLQMQQDTNMQNLPMQKITDMTLVFDSE